MNSKANNLLAIVEAAYRVEATDVDWLEGIASTCCPVLDGGFGICAFEFYYRTGSRPRILQSKTLRMPEALEKIYPVVFEKMDPSIQVRPFEYGPCTTASQMMGLAEDFKSNHLMQLYAQKFGIYDSMWITAAEPGGWGCGLHAGRAQIGRASRATIESWSRIAAHLSAAVRLRRRLARERDPDAPHLVAAEAVFSADGRLQHAEKPAQAPHAVDRLRQAVLDMEGARRRRQDDATNDGLKSWKGLVDARWSLLEQFESDGKRYIVATENAPSPPGPAALTLRERQVVGYAALGHDNKVIAYELGIAHSTVRVLMARGASKLGVRSRTELVSAYRRSCSEAPPAEPESPNVDGTRIQPPGTSLG